MVTNGFDSIPDLVMENIGDNNNNGRLKVCIYLFSGFIEI